MNYIGSKLSLLDFVQEGVDFILKKDNNPQRERIILCDLFAGTGIIGRFFKKQGFNIIANDLMFYSFVLNKHYIENNSLPFSPEKEEKIFKALNNIQLIDDGFIFNHYCEGGKNNDYQRMYFSVRNGQFCDAVRKQIEKWHQSSEINDGQYYYLLASLLESIDKYANTASVYAAFLKKIKKSASKEAILTPAKVITGNGDMFKVFQEDAEQLIKSISGDVLYLDPPYNSRQYCDNYHILETIAKYDYPDIKGKTGLRMDNQSFKSTFCSKSKAISSLESIIRQADFKYIVLSYNDEGIIGLDQIEEIMSKYGDYYRLEKPYKRFKSSTIDGQKSNTIEYLHCLIKGF